MPMQKSSMVPPEKASLCKFCKKLPTECENEVVKSMDLQKIYEYKSKNYYKNSTGGNRTVRFKGGIKHPFLLMCDNFEEKCKQKKGKRLNG
jgi:hypothetical protein